MAEHSHQPGMFSVTMFVRGKHPGYFSIEKVFQAVKQALPSHIDARIAAAPLHAQGLWRRLVCMAYARMQSSTVNHITGDISFVAAALPGSRTIVTIHDFERLYALSGIRAGMFRYVYFTIPVRHCRYVTTISSQIASEMKRLFPEIGDKILVIPDCLPIGYEYTPKLFNSACPVVLQIGARPNKNLESLVQAIEGESCELHIVGALSDQQRLLLERCRIRYRNSVGLSETALLNAYVQADMVSFVSTYEGFGLPILEANAVGRPVITSNIPPMSDVAGSAACLVDPQSVSSIREGFQRLKSDGVYRAELVQQGLENVRRYSAVDIAQQYAVLYERVARETCQLCEQRSEVVETL